MKLYTIAEIYRFHRNKVALPEVKKHILSSYHNFGKHPRQKKSECYSESTPQSWDHK